MGLRYALTGGGSLAESYVATGGYMRSDPSLASRTRSLLWFQLW